MLIGPRRKLGDAWLDEWPNLRSSLRTVSSICSLRLCKLSWGLTAPCVRPWKQPDSPSLTLAGWRLSEHALSVACARLCLLHPQRFLFLHNHLWRRGFSLLRQTAICSDLQWLAVELKEPQGKQRPEGQEFKVICGYTLNSRSV